MIDRVGHKGVGVETSRVIRHDEYSVRNTPRVMITTITSKKACVYGLPACAVIVDPTSREGGRHAEPSGITTKSIQGANTRVRKSELSRGE